MMTIREGKQSLIIPDALDTERAEIGQIYSSLVTPSLTSHDEGVFYSFLLGTKSHRLTAHIEPCQGRQIYSNTRTQHTYSQTRHGNKNRSCLSQSEYCSDSVDLEITRKTLCHLATQWTPNRNNQQTLWIPCQIELTPNGGRYLFRTPNSQGKSHSQLTSFSSSHIHSNGNDGSCQYHLQDRILPSQRISYQLLHTPTCATQPRSTSQHSQSSSLPQRMIPSSQSHSSPILSHLPHCRNCL